MVHANEDYLKLRGSYLFSAIGQKAAAYRSAHPERTLISLGIGDVTLHSIGHQNADNPVFSERFSAEGGGNTGILSSGNADDGFAALSVFFKIVSDPLHDFIFGPDRVPEHSVPPVNAY